MAENAPTSKYLKIEKIESPRGSSAGLEQQGPQFRHPFFRFMRENVCPTLKSPYTQLCLGCWGNFVHRIEYFRRNNNLIDFLFGIIFCYCVAGWFSSNELVQIAKPLAKIIGSIMLALCLTTDCMDNTSGIYEAEMNRCCIKFWSVEYFTSHLIKRNKRLATAFVGGILVGFMVY